MRNAIQFRCKKALLTCAFAFSTVWSPVGVNAQTPTAFVQQATAAVTVPALGLERLDKGSATQKESSPLALIQAEPPTLHFGFAHNDGRWSDFADESGASKVQGDTFQFTNKTSDALLWKVGDVVVTDFLVEVDTVQKVTDPHHYTGIIFRLVDGKNFYLFSITNDGHFDLTKLINGQWQSIRKLEASSAIKQGANAQNRLGVLAIGSTITLTANGVVLATVEDSTLRAGDIALALETDGTPNITVAFDNFNLWDLHQFAPDVRLALHGKKVSDLATAELLALGDDYYFHGSLAYAFQLYDQAIKADNRNAAAYVGRGHVYRLQENYAAARQDFTQALQVNAKYAPAYRGFGALLDAEGDPFQALEYVNKAIELDQHYALAYYYRGWIYWVQNSLDAALAEFTQAIALEPTNSEFYYHRGRLYTAQDNLFAAMADFNKAIALYPQDATYYAERAALYTKQEEYWSAVNDTNRAIALAPQNGTYYTDRGHLFYNYFKDYQLAFVNYDQAVQLEPKNGYLYYFRGDAYLESKNYRAAITDYDQALTLLPTYAMPYYKRARAYEERWEWQKAYDDYARYLELEPGDTAAARHACEQVNWLHFTLSKDVLSAFVNVLLQPCNRFPGEAYTTTGNNYADSYTTQEQSPAYDEEVIENDWMKPKDYYNASSGKYQSESCMSCSYDPYKLEDPYAPEE